MRKVPSLKELNGANHAMMFTRLFQSIVRKLSFNPRWADKTDQSDLSRMVFDPLERLILQPGEMFSCTYQRLGSDKERRRHPRQGLNSPIILFGTPYGLACIHYMFERHRSDPVNPMFEGLDPGVVHMTIPLRNAIMRLLERKPEFLLSLSAADRKDMTIEKFAKFLLLTENFDKEIDEQAELDRAAGIDVSDGFAPLVKAPKKPQPERRAYSAKPDPNKGKNFERRLANHNSNLPSTPSPIVMPLPVPEAIIAAVPEAAPAPRYGQYHNGTPPSAHSNSAKACNP